MSLRSEAVEAMAAAHILFAARAPVLAVIDEYEEVEVNTHRDGDWAYLPCGGRRAKFGNSPDYRVETFLRRKQKPKPDLEALARRAVKAWRSGCAFTVPEAAAMEALAEAVDE